MAADTPEMDGSDMDAQDIAEVFDEDNLDSDSARLARNDEELNFDDMPQVYDATSAVGDSDDDDALIGEDLDDEEIVELSRQEADERENREDANDYRASEAYDEDEEDLTGGETDVGLSYAGDLSQTPGAHSGAQRYESRSLSDSDLEELGYGDTPESGSDTGGSRSGPAVSEARTFKDKAAASSKAEDGAHEEAALDEGLKETFPASDPVAVKHIT